MRFLRPVLWLVVVLGLIPGGLEMFEDTGHLLVLGHLEEGACADACDDSGCTPGTHACSCCASTRLAAADAQVSVPEAQPSGELERPRAARAARPGFGRRLLRPPTA